MPPAQAMLATPGCCSGLMPLLPPRDIKHAQQTVLRAWSFSPSRDKQKNTASGKNIAGVRLCTLVSASFF